MGGDSGLVWERRRWKEGCRDNQAPVNSSSVVAEKKSSKKMNKKVMTTCSRLPFARIVSVLRTLV